MDISQLWQIISTGIIAIGGAGVIFWKASSYFGKIWADKYLESVKKEYTKEIEAYKNQLEIMKQASLRYSTQQFDLYNKLWRSLHGLKIASDNLWNEANAGNLFTFSRLLSEAINEIEQSSLLIEDTHYLEMHKLLDELGEYRLGKVKIIDLHRKRDEFLQINDITHWTNHNLNSKLKFENLLEEIRKELKQQIKGTIN
jgi:hypothetical protein